MLPCLHGPFRQAGRHQFTYLMSKAALSSFFTHILIFMEKAIISQIYRWDRRGAISHLAFQGFFNYSKYHTMNNSITFNLSIISCLESLRVLWRYDPRTTSMTSLLTFLDLFLVNSVYLVSSYWNNPFNFWIFVWYLTLFNTHVYILWQFLFLVKSFILDFYFFLNLRQVSNITYSKIHLTLWYIRLFLLLCCKNSNHHLQRRE